MNFFKRIDQHAALVGQMADTVGIDVGEAMASGRLEPESLRGAVLRCMRCDSVEECSAWLYAHADATAESPPDYCRNRELLERLAG
ncbi:DUF6455 family protein [Alkalilacustris brevis]|uniref:DUF6455 family protein n=1 Tax=Alkalilacustris brevis TaxID=2026338 RepID=UPI000E0CCED8|nr:DUF6455 family protein [Alkalilacustris brevis]